MPNVNLSVNPGESKTLTFNTEDTYMPEDLVFDITANSNYIVGNPESPGTPTPNSVTQSTTSPVSAAIWRGNCENISSLYSGLRVTYKVPVVGGATYGTVLNINELGYHPVVNNNNNDKIGAVSVGSIIDLVYDAVPSYSIYLDGLTTSGTGVWKVCVPMANATTAGIVKLGAYGGAATFAHIHSDYLTSVSVDGLEGSSIIHSVSCNTASGTAMKQVTPNNTFSVNGGSSLTIKFNYDNTADNPTLSVDDGQSGKLIFYKGKQLTNITGNASFIKGGRLYEFVFDRRQDRWDIVGGIDETYNYFIDASNYNNGTFTNIIHFENNNSLYTDSVGNHLDFTSANVFDAISKHIILNERVNVFVKLPGGYEIILFENPVFNASSGCIVFTSSSFEVDSTHIEQSWWRISTLEIFDENYSGGLTRIRNSYFRPFAPNTNTITAARYGRINNVSSAPESIGTSNIGGVEYVSCIQIPPDVEFEGYLSTSWALNVSNNFTNFPSVSTYYKSLINTNTTISINLTNLNVGETFYILLKHSGSTAHNVTFQPSNSNITLYGAGTYNLGGTGLMEFSFLVLSKTIVTNVTTGEILLTYNEYINI